LVRRHIRCAQKTGGRCFLLWRWVSSSPRPTRHQLMLAHHIVLICRDEFILNKLVSLYHCAPIRTAISLELIVTDLFKSYT
jgi:hypothetical protein